MQKSSISTYRAQRLDRKNDVILLVVFTPKTMAIRMPKIALFMQFLLNTEKKTDPVWRRYLNPSERSYLALLQNTMD